jgi:hypothetical protein
VTLIGIANDGVRIYAELNGEGKSYCWGETVEGEHVELASFEMERSIDKSLPPGEYPADVITYRRVETS